MSATTDLLEIASATECYAAFRQAGNHKIPVETCLASLFRSASLRAGLTFSDYIDLRRRAHHAIAERKAKAQADKTSWRAWFQAIGRKAPNTAAFGLFLIGPGGKYLEFHTPIGPASDRLAQYTAISRLLDEATKAGIKKLNVFGPADQTINEVNGDLPAPTAATKIFCKLIKKKTQAFKKIAFIATEKPHPLADSLAQLALTQPFDAAGRSPAGNLTDVGALLHQSAATTGRLLIVAGLRSNAKPTPKAFEQGVASFSSNAFGISTKWNIDRTAALLEPIAADLGLMKTRPRPARSPRSNAIAAAKGVKSPPGSKPDDDDLSPKLTQLANVKPKTGANLDFNESADPA